MPNFAYTARDTQGSPVQGELEAPSERSVAEQLQRGGITPITITPSKSSPADDSTKALRFGQQKVSLEEIVMLARQLRTLTKAGVPILRGLPVRFPAEVEIREWREGDCLWVRADLATFWRLAREAHWPVSHHYLLYPNPWPKPGQLQRRWHAHPVFPTVLELGGRLEMRTNWRIYAEEFALALEHYTGAAVRPSTLQVKEPVSPFERKYRDSGHPLYSVVLDSSGV